MLLDIVCGVVGAAFLVAGRASGAGRPMARLVAMALAIVAARPVGALAFAALGAAWETPAALELYLSLVLGAGLTTYLAAVVVMRVWGARLGRRGEDPEAALMRGAARKLDDTLPGLRLSTHVPSALSRHAGALLGLVQGVAVVYATLGSTAVWRGTVAPADSRVVEFVAETLESSGFVALVERRNVVAEWTLPGLRALRGPLSDTARARLGALATDFDASTLLASGNLAELLRTPAFRDAVRRPDFARYLALGHE